MRWADRVKYRDFQRYWPKLVHVKSAIKQHPFKTGISVIGAMLAVFVYICFPHGYKQLSVLESSVGQVTANGASIADVRSDLSRLGIQYNQYVQSKAGPVIQVGQKELDADPGQQVLVALMPTDAWHFPCQERLDIVAVFDGEGKLVRRYIGRFHICP